MTTPDFNAHLSWVGNTPPAGEIDWSRLRVIAWFDPADAGTDMSVPVEAEQASATDNLLQLFLAACTERNPTAVVSSFLLYEAFADWCAANGHPWWSHRAFSHAMLEAGYVKYVRGGLSWGGISLMRPETDGGQ